MRVSFEALEQEEDGYRVTVGDDDPSPATVSLVDQFPRPAEGSIRSDQTEKLLADPPLLEQYYLQLVSEEASAQAMAALGSYLFDVAFATDEAWARVLRAAEGGVATVELFIPPDAWALRRLPWELIRARDADAAGERFVARRGMPRVSVVRLVEPDVQPAAGAQRVEPRILFVVGAAADDARVRPGAEFFGILRRLERNGPRPQVRILLEATLEAVRDAVSTWRPSIVHFIGHGNQTAIELRDGDGEPRDVTAQQFADHLQSRASGDEGNPVLGPLPPLVVLNACNAAGTPIPQVMQAEEPSKPTLDFASDLVQRGVPMVIGMAGRISDTAGRLFVRLFYRHLLGRNGGHGATNQRAFDVLGAVQEARRASTAELGVTRLGWVLPTVTQSAALAEQTWTIDGLDELRFREEMARTVGQQSHFCDRLDLLANFARWLDDSWPPVFALVDPSERSAPATTAGETEPSDRYGTTWAVRELAVHLAHEGYLVHLFANDQADAPPRTVRELAERILDPLVPLPGGPQEHPWLRFAEAIDDPGASPPPGVEKATLRKARRLASREDKSAFWALVLREALAASHRAHRRVAVVLDGIHEYGHLLHELCAEKTTALLTRHGMGTEAQPVRVILAVRQPASGGNPDVAYLLGRDWVDDGNRVGAFAESAADLAYTQYLLGCRTPGPLVVAQTEEGEFGMRLLMRLFGKEVEGVPSRLDPLPSSVQTLIELLVDDQQLVAADDEDRVLGRTGAAAE
ncbi:MAG: CHAT domain-containing protein [Sandaracinaceae bacterium]